LIRKSLKTNEVQQSTLLCVVDNITISISIENISLRNLDRQE
jgi:hypothetical protein